MRYSLTVLMMSLMLATSTHSAEKPTAIVGGTLINVATGELLNDALVVFEGERITYAGPSTAHPVPAGVEVLQARGKYLLPGLADMHNHLADGTFRLGGPPPDHDRNLRCMLRWGFTTIYSPGLPLDEIEKLQSSTAADIRGYPNFRTTGPPITAPGGHGAHGAFAPPTSEAAREAVRKLKATGANAIKIVYTDLTYVTTQPRPMLKREVMEAIIDEAHQLGLKVYVHAPILRYAKEALRAGADGMAHGIVSEPVDAEFIALMKKNHAFYMPTHSIFYSAADMTSWAERVAEFDSTGPNGAGRIPREILEVGLDPQVQQQWNARWDNLEWLRNHLGVMRRNVRTVTDAGLLVLMGSDTSESGTGTLLGLCSQIELQLMVEAGLSPLETLQTATLNPAKMLGREADLGSLEAGKLADILVLDANPLRDIKNVRHIFRVIKAGRVYNPADSQACP